MGQSNPQHLIPLVNRKLNESYLNRNNLDITPTSRKLQKNPLNLIILSVESLSDDYLIR